DGFGEHRRAPRVARRGNRRVVPRDAPAQPARTAHDQGLDERGRRRARGHPTTRRRRHTALLPNRRSARRPRRLRRQTPTGLHEVPKASVNKWVAGARPRTLPAAVVPVLVGTACAVGDVTIIWWRAIAALIAAVALQV